MDPHAFRSRSFITRDSIMIPYFQNIADVIPFHIDDLVAKDAALPLDFDVDTDNYVRKNVFDDSVLNPDFVKWMASEADLNIQKVVIWHWKTDSDPRVAHIDSDVNGKISPGTALNWTLSKGYTTVSWYDKKPSEYRVSMANEADKRWNTPNVEAYIAVDVDYKDRVAEWSDRGPVILDTSIPHMIYAVDSTRVSVSLNFGEYTFFDDLRSKFDRLREK